MNDWNIQSRSRSCQACQRAFGDGEAYHTLLYQQRSGWERLDVCPQCWEDQHRHGAQDRKGFVSHWQGTFTVPPPRPPEPIQRESAETLLRALTERPAAGGQAAAFILAVMLERKRILKLRESFRQNGTRLFVYEHPRTGEVFTLLEPELRLDQLEEVQREVAHLLQHGLPPESVPATDAGSGEENRAEGGPVEEPFVPASSGSPAPGLPPDPTVEELTTSP